MSLIIVLQARRLNPEKVEKSLTSAVEDLEAAVSALTGEKFGDKDSGGSLRRRIAALCGVQVTNTLSLSIFASRK